MAFDRKSFVHLSSPRDLPVDPQEDSPAERVAGNGRDAERGDDDYGAAEHVLLLEREHINLMEVYALLPIPPLPSLPDGIRLAAAHYSLLTTHYSLLTTHY